MAINGSFICTGGYGGRTLRFAWEVASQSTSANSTTIRWTLTGYGDASFNYCRAGAFRVVIDGVVVYSTSSSDRISLYKDTVVASGTRTITHNADGTRLFTASAQGALYETSVNTQGSETWALPNIVRSTYISLSLGDKTETSAVVFWNTTDIIDRLWVSTDDGATFRQIAIADSKSGTVTLDGLTAGSSYLTCFKARRKDTQVESTSLTIEVATWSYPYAYDAPPFMIGSANISIPLFNPLNRQVTVTLKKRDTNIVIGTWTGTGTAATGFNSAADIDAQYASIPNSKYGLYDVEVTSSASPTTTVYVGQNAKYTVRNGGYYDHATYADVNPVTLAVTQNYTQIIQAKSIVNFHVYGIYTQPYASVVACWAEYNGQDYPLTISGDEADGGGVVVDSAVNIDIPVKIRDSRGFVHTQSCRLWMTPWTPPTANIRIKRLNNYYSETDITVDAVYSPLKDAGGVPLNTIAIKYRTKQLPSGSWSAYTTISDGVTARMVISNDHEWSVEIVLTDAFASTTYQEHVAVGLPIIFFDRLLFSVGVGCFPTDSNALEVRGINILKAIRYEDGETETLGGMLTGGVLTNSATRVMFSVVLPRSMDNMTVTLNALKLNVWHTGGGYVLSNAYEADGHDVIADSSITVTMSKVSANTLAFALDKNDLTQFNGTNNTPIGVLINTISITLAEA